MSRRGQADDRQGAHVDMMIYYDSLQEGRWFKSLSPRLKDSILSPFPAKKEITGLLAKTLDYDRPDIILVDRGQPILVVERTVEVPSGHNVGQRFARLVAAAQMHIPVVYFGPFAAYKHGGATQGPRYMNLRFFYAASQLSRIEGSAVTLVNWPVDSKYEVIKNPIKDKRMIEYLHIFFDSYGPGHLEQTSLEIMNSGFEAEQNDERKEFISREVTNPEQYEVPPESVKIGPPESVQKGRTLPSSLGDEIVLYNVGMTYIRSDPYCGMAMLYAYLYCGGMANRTRSLVLHFPNITTAKWREATSARDGKSVRLYRLVSDGILFSDGYSPKNDL